MKVRPEDIREVEVTIKKYVWICPICGKVVSSFTKQMTMKYAVLHLKLKHML